VLQIAIRRKMNRRDSDINRFNRLKSDSLELVGVWIKGHFVWRGCFVGFLGQRAVVATLSVADHKGNEHQD
jgi:hypothetical protein